MNIQSTQCPKCNKYTVVPHGDNVYECINPECDFKKDLSKPEEPKGTTDWFPLLLLVTFFLLALFTL